MKLILILCAIFTLSACEETETKHEEPLPTVSNTRMPECQHVTTIAVIDSGFGAGWEGENTAHICKYGHKNFVDENNSDQFKTVVPVPIDEHGHGTHIGGIIDKYARQTNNSFCLVILKYYSPNANGYDNLSNTIKAIDYARKIKVDFINYSGGGVDSSDDEKRAVKEYLDGGGIFVAAAGNEYSNLANLHYYPAEDDNRVIVVGNGFGPADHAKSSNWGDRVNEWEDGFSVKMYAHYMTGTSQSAAIATGKMVAEKNLRCK